MSVETDPVPPVPSTTPVLNDNTGNQEGNRKLFENNWVQWLLNLRTKINVLNALLVSISKLTGAGFISISGGLAAVRTFLGPDSVKITNPDGSGGDPIFRLENDDSSLTPLTAYGKNMAGVRGWYRPALFESTGLLDGGVLSINAGDPTKYDVSQAIVGFTDYSTNAAAPSREVHISGPFVAQSVPSLAVIATYIGLQLPAGTIITQSSPFLAPQYRSIVPLGAVISNGVQLIAVNNLPNVMRAGINQLQDLMNAIGAMNLTGNVIGPNGVNLNVNKSAGAIFKQGSNFQNNEDNPHGLVLAALAPANFNYRLSDGTQFATTALVDPNNYESPLGTLTAVPAANRFTIQRFSVFTSNLIRVQYGQFVYNTLAEAEAALATEAFVTEANIAENGLLLCFLIVQDGAVDLSNPAEAKFIPASKFGGPVGSGGTSITNTDALPEGAVNLYFTDARARAAVIAATVTNGDTTHSPSGDAVFDYLVANYQPLDADLTAVAALGGTGFATRTAANTWAQRSFPNGTGFTWTNPAGVAGDPTLVLSTNLQAWSGVTTASKADDANVLHTSGNETATGTKTFSTDVVVGAVSNTIPFTPSLRVEFDDTVALASGVFIRYGATTASAFVGGFKARGTAGAPTQTMSGDSLMGLRGGGWHSGGAFGGSQAGEISIRATEDFTSTAQGTRIAFRTTPNGTASATDRWTVDQNGDCFVTGGRLYGTALHNNAAALTGTTNQYVGSGTYTPTLTNVANVAATTSAVCQWMRVGNVVTVSGRINVTTTAAAGTVTQLRVTLPIASAFAGVAQLAGAGGRQSAGAVEPISINADAVNDEALLTFYSTANPSVGTTFTFSYVVL